jgi:type I restriction enzyme S subunit
MKRIPVFLPSPEEQIAIVDFTGRIDCAIRKLIRAKRRVIELLNEQKQAIIQRAVTRGLDPNVRLKPSGIKWLGEIPKHWNSNPAKYSLLEVDKRSTSGEEELLSVSHLTGVSPRSQKNITMFMAASYVGHKLCEPGDLVVNTMWAWMGALGVSPMKGIVSPSYAVYRPRREGAFVPGFLDCLLRTRPYISEFICRSTGIRSSRLRVYPEQFLKIPLIQPPLSEQAQIVESIQMETESAERSIYRAQQEIDLLREYRSRLITDVVTGKLDVRGIELPELNEVEEVSDVEDEELEDSEELEAVKENVDAD